MKRFLVTTMAVAMLITVAAAKPTVSAGNGLFRVQNASNMGKGTLGLNLHWAGNPVGAYHMNDGDFSTWDGVLRFGVSWVPLNYLEVGVVPALGYYKPTSDADAQVGLWDLELNAKASYSNLNVLKLGVQAKTLLPLADDAFFPTDYNNGLDIGVRGLGTADLRDAIAFPLLLHLNAGYLMTGDDIAGTDVTDYIIFGFGIEIPTRFVTFFTELYTESPTDGEQSSDLWLTPNLRFTLPFGLNIEYAMDFLLLQNEDDPREGVYRTVTTGISWSPPEKKHIPMGEVAGKVKDIETGKGLIAKVSYTGPETGLVNAGSMGFEVDSLDPGVYTFEAVADGYQSVKKTVTVVDGKTAKVEFMLKPGMVTLSGAVHDRKTDKGLPAVVRFVDASIGDVKTDPATGLYKVQLKPGTYGVEVLSEGYLPQTASIIVGKNGAVKDFKLIKKGMKIAFRGINFETAKAVILPESYPILDEAAQILKDNPDIRVEVGGHTDSRGSASYNQDLSQRRAAAVRLYLIEKHGIAGNRMIAKGYGESQPVAPNDTEENMYKNRRVEFTILGK